MAVFVATNSIPGTGRHVARDLLKERLVTTPTRGPGPQLILGATPSSRLSALIGQGLWFTARNSIPVMPIGAIIGVPGSGTWLAEALLQAWNRNRVRGETLPKHLHLTPENGRMSLIEKYAASEDGRILIVDGVLTGSDAPERRALRAALQALTAQGLRAGRLLVLIDHVRGPARQAEGVHCLSLCSGADFLPA